MEKWQQNLQHNLKTLDWSRVNIRQIHNSEKRCAIVVGAGPSVDKNFHLLHSVDRSKFCIISTTTMVPVFIKYGIEPDYIQITSENNPFTQCFLGHSFKETVIVATSTAPPGAFDFWPNRYYLYHNMTTRIRDRLQKADFPKIIPGLDPISHNGGFHGIEIAHYLGCPKIAFIGIDLCLRGKEHHAKDVDYSIYEFDLANPDNWRWMENSYARSLSLVARYAKKRENREIYNCTEGGAVEDFPKMSLAAFIATIVTTPTP